MSDTIETTGEERKFDFSAYPENTLFYDRRKGLERRAAEEAASAANVPPTFALERSTELKAPVVRRAKQERRKRIDPTTFEKQYTSDEIEFMTAMQRFKELTAKQFPTYGEVLDVAYDLGYRRLRSSDDDKADALKPFESEAVEVAIATV